MPIPNTTAPTASAEPGAPPAGLARGAYPAPAWAVVAGTVAILAVALLGLVRGARRRAMAARARGHASDSNRGASSNP